MDKLDEVEAEKADNSEEEVNELIFSAYLIRPPFINGRPQDSDSVFWTLVPFFEPLVPLFFQLHHF